MPTYEYECDKCGYRFERFQRMSDTSIERCPHCSGPARRLIGGGGAVLIRGSASRNQNHREHRASARLRCDRMRPCCGREQPCDSPPCAE